MYELIATDAAGIQAGLHTAIAGPPNGGGSAQYFHSRSRFLSLVLSMTSCGCATAAYFEEGRGNLWLVAATGAALSIPYHILLMSPSKPYIPATSGVGAVDEAANALGGTLAADSSVSPAILASHKLATPR